MREPDASELALISNLLASSGLPTDDLDKLDLADVRVVEESGRVVAVGAIEHHGDAALLRSVVTDPIAQGRGLARSMVDALDALCRERGVQDLYLLTDTAADYFERLGFRECARSAAPRAIRVTRQFSTLCPDSATLMHRHLDV